MKKQAGFTLIELAIVLVIIGLLLGGVLKGQELINSAKVKNMANDFKNTQIILYGYQDKFRALPGDDSNVGNHVTNGTLATTPAAPAARGNARIEGAWNSDTATDESFLFWQHARLAGLAPGSTVTNDLQAYLPRNADGGRIGIQSIAGFTTITGMTGAYVICSDGIVGKLAKQIDVALDDGSPATGGVQVVAQGTTGAPLASAAVTDSAYHTVCMAF
jgi:prepilin-type N-terminal cleavage/methylation domain-containing protein